MKRLKKVQRLKVTAKAKKTKRPDAKVKIFSIQKGFLKVTAKLKKTKRPDAEVYLLQNLKRPSEVKRTKRPNAKAKTVKNRGDSYLALRARFDRLKNL